MPVAHQRHALPAVILWPSAIVVLPSSNNAGPTIMSAAVAGFIPSVHCAPTPTLSDVTVTT
jgi:hypothetical protein